MQTLSTAIHFIFAGYTLMLFVRIVGSWFPDYQKFSLIRFVNYYTDPYLRVFKRIVPQLGILDLSPLLGFFALRLMERFILGFIH